MPYCTEILHAGNVKGMLERQWDRKKRMQAEMVKWLTYLGDRVCAGGGCKAARTVRTRCGWVGSKECGEFLYRKTLLLKLNWAVYLSCARPSIL